MRIALSKIFVYIFVYNERQRAFIEGRAARPLPPRQHNAKRLLINNLLAVIILFAGLVLALIAVAHIVNWYQFSSSAVETDVLIIQKRYVPVDDGNDKAYILYRYDVAFHGDAVEYEGETQVSLQEYEQLQPGMVVPVMYLPAEPSMSRPAGQYGAMAAISLTVAALFTSGLDIILLVQTWRRWKRTSHLWRKGNLIFGKFVSYTVEEYNDRILQANLALPICFTAKRDKYRGRFSATHR